MLALAGRPARCESFAVGDRPPTADRIDFKVDLQPWDAFADANKAGRRGNSVAARWSGSSFRGRRTPGFHTYPMTTQYKDESGNVNTISYGKSDDLQPLWPIAETPAPESVLEEGVGYYFEYRKPFTWVQDIYIKPGATAGAASPELYAFTSRSATRAAFSATTSSTCRSPSSTGRRRRRRPTSRSGSRRQSPRGELLPPPPSRDGPKALPSQDIGPPAAAATAEKPAASRRLPSRNRRRPRRRPLGSARFHVAGRRLWAPCRC